MIEVESLRTRHNLAIGVGGPLSVLNFVGSSGDPPYFTSLGDPSATGTMTFVFSGEKSEFPLRNAIPIEMARQAIRMFAVTGERPMTTVQWEED